MDEEKREVVKKLIRDTLAGAGDLDPSALPHRVKAQLAGQALGDKDIDAVIADLRAEIERETGRG